MKVCSNQTHQTTPTSRVRQWEISSKEKIARRGGNFAQLFRSNQSCIATHLTVNKLNTPFAHRRKK